MCGFESCGSGLVIRPLSSFFSPSASGFIRETSRAMWTRSAEGSPSPPSPLWCEILSPWVCPSGRLEEEQICGCSPGDSLDLLGLVCFLIGRLLKMLFKIQNFLKLIIYLFLVVLGLSCGRRAP